MKDIKQVFEQIQQHKKEHRDLNLAVKDSLRNTPEYHDLTDQIDRLKVKRAKIEQSAMDDVIHKIDLLKANIKDGVQLMSDIALSTLMKGEEVKLVDDKDNEYEPIFSVRFKKTNTKNFDSKK